MLIVWRSTRRYRSFLPEVPITGVAGDQQAALFGQGGFQPAKRSAPTAPARSSCRTPARQPISFAPSPPDQSGRRLPDATPQYVLEGSVFIAGAAVQWLRDGLHVLAQSSDSETLAAQSSAEEPILLVPGFVGLGAPHWLPTCAVSCSA